MCNVLIKKHTSNINNRKNIKYKEVIQPQVPLRLPCYDFAPVAYPTVVARPPCGLPQRRQAEQTPMA